MPNTQLITFSRSQITQMQTPVLVLALKLWANKLSPGTVADINTVIKSRQKAA